MTIQSFTTPHSIEMYRMTVIRSALKLYIKTGMKANTMYTPSNMLAAISKKSGKQYKKSKQGYAEAFNDLEQWLMTHRTLNNEELPL
jgi:hypothetical protein